MKPHLLLTEGGLLPKPKAIIFDWDGTLANTLPVMQFTVNRVLATFDHAPVTLNTAQMASVTSTKDLFINLLGETRGHAAKDQYEKHLDEFYAQNDAAYLQQLACAETKALIEFLHQKKVKLAIATNKRRQRFAPEFAATGLAQYFYCTITLDEVEHRKPHPQMVQAAITQLNMRPCKEVWMVGDHRVDSESAIQAGIAALHLQHGRPNQVSETHAPDLILKDIAELRALTMRYFA